MISFTRGALLLTGMAECVCLACMIAALAWPAARFALIPVIALQGFSTFRKYQIVSTLPPDGES